MSEAVVVIAKMRFIWCRATLHAPYTHGLNGQYQMNLSLDRYVDGSKSSRFDPDPSTSPNPNPDPNSDPNPNGLPTVARPA